MELIHSGAARWKYMKGMSEGERLSMLSSPSSPGARRGVPGQSLARIRLEKGSEMTSTDKWAIRVSLALMIVVATVYVKLWRAGVLSSEFGVLLVAVWLASGFIGQLSRRRR